MITMTITVVTLMIKTTADCDEDDWDDNAEDDDDEYDNDGPAYIMFTPINTRMCCRWTKWNNITLFFY